VSLGAMERARVRAGGPGMFPDGGWVMRFLPC
jgi:hypothetical protein